MSEKRECPLAALAEARKRLDESGIKPNVILARIMAINGVRIHPQAIFDVLTQDRRHYG